MSSEELYNDCKKKLSDFLDSGENKLVIISGSGKNGKTTLLNEMKDKINNKKYCVLADITKNNLLHLKNVTNLKKLTNIMFEICGDLYDLDNNNDFFHINMNNINF